MPAKLLNKRDLGILSLDDSPKKPGSPSEGAPGGGGKGNTPRQHNCQRGGRF
jgi:hypothetical protein